jgi:hypothetical protein
VVLTRSGLVLAPSLDSSGSFAVGSGSSLPAGQYLAGAVLSDRQQRRQDVYRKYLARPRPAHSVGQDLLLAWTDAEEVPFESGSPARRFSSSLLVVPLDIERPARDTSVTIPAGFCSFTATTKGRSHRATLEGTIAVRNHLRFQLPPSILPFEPERATLVARVHAPGRRFTVTVNEDGTPLFESLNLLESVRIDITDPRALRIDPAGGLFIDIAVSGTIGPDGKEASRLTDTDVKWQIEELGLELRGRVRGQ